MIRPEWAPAIGPLNHRPEDGASPGPNPGTAPALTASIPERGRRERDFGGGAAVDGMPALPVRTPTGLCAGVTLGRGGKDRTAIGARGVWPCSP